MLVKREGENRDHVLVRHGRDEQKDNHKKEKTLQL